MRTASDIRAVPTRTLDRPGSWGRRNTACTRGRRRSPSITSVRWSACASATPRFVEMSVLPSPGAVLVTTTVRAPSSADEKITAVRTARIASPKPGGRSPVKSRPSSPTGLTFTAGTRPRNGRFRACLSSSGVLIRLSRYSKPNTRTSASTSPSAKATDKSRLTLGDDGARGTSAASTIVMLLPLNCPETPVSLVRANRVSKSVLLLASSRCRLAHSTPFRSRLNVCWFC